MGRGRDERQPLLGRGGPLSPEEIQEATFYHQYAVTDPLAAGPKYIDPQVHPDADSNRRSSLATAIFHTWNATIGVGILAMPRAFALVGWATGSALLLLFSLLCMRTFLMLGSAMRHTNVYTFGGLMRATAGPATAEFTDLIIFLFLFGVMVVYAQVVAAITVDLLGDWNGLPLGNDIHWLDNRRLFVLVFGLGAFWPLSLFPQLHFLKHVSLAATVAMCYVVCVVVARMFQQVAEGGPRAPCVVGDIDGATCAEPVVRSAGFLDYASALSAFSFALTTHTSLPPIVSELERPTAERTNVVVQALVWFASALYLVTGLSGLFLFGSRQCPVVSNAFSPDDRLMQAGQLAVVACVTFGAPVQAFQARVSLDRLLRVDRWLFTGDDPVCGLKPSTARSMTTATVIILSSVAVAFFVKDLDAVIDLSGALGGAVTAFVLPPLAYASCGRSQGVSAVGMTVRALWVVFGVLLSIFLTGVTIYGIWDKKLPDEDIGEQTCGGNT